MDQTPVKGVGREALEDVYLNINVQTSPLWIRHQSRVLWCLVILLKYLVIYYSEVMNDCSTYVVIDVFIMVVTSWIAFVYISVRTETLYCMGA